GFAAALSASWTARLSGSVFDIEEAEALARLARENLAAVGAASATVVTGPLTQGWQESAPYDVIFVNGASEIVPQALARQLKEDGRLVAVLGRAPVSPALVYPRVGRGISGWPVFDAAAPLLPGFAAPPAFVF